jgi:apolipoprotein D and lipocalin family protein
VNKRLEVILMMGIFTLFGGCKSVHPPLATAPAVELARFMGDWYVIGNIPTSIEREAFNPVESYRLDADGTIATTFAFRKGAFDGPLKTYCPRGFVLDTRSNAVWGMRFVWPIKSDYRIVYVSGNYDRTIVGREKRDYVWIMARTPRMADADYEELLSIVAREGYDVSKVRRVPQQWPEGAPRPSGECS